MSETEHALTGRIVRVWSTPVTSLPPLVRVLDLGPVTLHYQPMAADPTWDPPFRPEGEEAWVWLGHVGRMELVA